MATQRDLSAFSLNLWLSKQGGSVDAFYDGHILLRELRGTSSTSRGVAKQKKMWRELDGGDYIQDSPRIVQSRASTKIRGMEEVDATPEEVTKKALWEWAMYGKIIAIADFDSLRNSGQTKIIDDWQDRVTEAVDRIKYDVEVDIGAANHTGTSGWAGVNGLDSLINETNTSPTTLAALTRSSYTGWKNKVTDVSASFASVGGGADDLDVHLAQILAATGLQVDLMLCPAAVWGAMHKYLRSLGQVQFQDNTAQDAGYPEFRYMGAPVRASQHIKAESLYTLNTKMLWFATHKRANFALKEEQEATQQFGKTRKLCFMGNWGGRRFDCHGVVHDITS